MIESMARETVYVVRRRLFDTGDTYPELLGESLERRTFTRREAAEALWHRAEEEARVRFRKANPFQAVPPEWRAEPVVPQWVELTTLEPAALVDWLIEHGVEPPPLLAHRDGVMSASDLEVWRWWWAESIRHWGDEPCSLCWRALNRYRFHDLLEVPLVRKANFHKAGRRA